MTKLQYLTALAFLLVFTSCSDNEDDVVPDGVTYKVSFELNWNASDFPQDYPGNAHFSPLIGWSHTQTAEFFREGSMASEGIENMAETGGTSPLDDEINNRIGFGEGLDLVIGEGLSSGTGTISLEIVVDAARPFVTLATMIAPSPDWYAGIKGVSLIQNSEFVDRLETEIRTFDAGTDDGVSYASENAETDPQQPIRAFLDSPLGNGSVLHASIGRVVFERK